MLLKDPASKCANLCIFTIDGYHYVVILIKFICLLLDNLNNLLEFEVLFFLVKFDYQFCQSPDCSVNHL